MAQKRPNVILYTTDQHRGDHLGLAGHPLVETPNVDSWIGRGAYFPSAYTEIPSTTGARRCLLGGQGSHDCGLIGYAGVEWHEPNTLAAVLAAAGYHCINVGWRNLHPRRKLYGFHHVVCHDLREGVDDYADWLRRELGEGASQFGHGCDPNGWQARPWHLEERYHPTVWTTDVAIEAIEKRDPTRPFFLWLSHLFPHSPYVPPQFYWDMYIDRPMPDPPVGDWAAAYAAGQPGLDRTAYFGRLTDRQSRRARAGYMGLIAHIDAECGRLMEHLARKLGVLNETLWVFTSDHGDMMGDHHLHRKTYAYEGSARIPMVLRYPAGLDWPTGRCERVVGLQDVMPTILAAAGVEVPPSVTGSGMLSALRGGPWREFIHGEHSPCYSVEEAMHYLTDAKEKYIYFPATGRERFFDLAADPRELHDLAGDPAAADRVAKWRRRLIEVLARRGDGFSDGQRLLVRKDRWPAEVQR